MKSLNFRILLSTTIFSILIFILLSAFSYLKTKVGVYDYRLYAPLKYYEQFSLDHKQGMTNWGWNTNNLLGNLVGIWISTLIVHIVIRRTKNNKSKS